MPEGPEIHIAARFINNTAKHHRFGGSIDKSEVSTKNPTVEWSAKEYNIRAEARGKELKIHVVDAKDKTSKTHLLLRFGMSGCFKLSDADDMPKHAHLRFYTINSKKKQALCFVDYRRFGRWELEGEWGKDRGPDPIYDYDTFRTNIFDNLDKPAFNRPICEVMLNQKYFNGIGNYLRAEILYRCGIKPFDPARKVLEIVKAESDVKKEEPDLISLCNIVTKEVLALESGKAYDADESQKSQETFSSWLQCYYVEGMRNLEDGNGRTMWFSGEAGSMAPKVKKEKGRKGKKGTQIPQSGPAKSEPAEVQIKTETDHDYTKKSSKALAKKETATKKKNKAVNKRSVKVEVKEVKKIKEEKAPPKKRKMKESNTADIKQPRKSSSRRCSADQDFKKFF